MRLWLLKLEDDGGKTIYDGNYGHVVRAVDSSEARMMASKAANDEGPNVWLDNSKVSCTELLQSGDAEIILTDFCAG